VNFSATLDYMKCVINSIDEVLLMSLTREVL